MSHNNNEEVIDNTGVWYRKNDWKDFYLNFDADTIPEGCTRAKPLDGVEYQRFDEATGVWVEDLPPEPTYIDQRLAAYPSVGDQMDMIYHDRADGTDTWVQKIREIKEMYPKPE
jgi:hypothetical protein